MSTTNHVAIRTRHAIARPLKVLVPLIQKDLEAAETAASRAGLPYYQAAGEKLREAKPQVSNFAPWVSRNFHIGLRQAYRYMKLAEMAEQGGRDFVVDDKPLSATIGEASKGAPTRAWERLAAETRKLDRELFGQEPQARSNEVQLHRELAEELIDIGYRALATRLHPDKGGSKDAMRRLNRVAEELRDIAKTRRFA
jgi:hypothetical protein